MVISPKRARSDNQKQQRREAILDSATKHLVEVGFDNFSMATLATSVGLAKGTLYLYFKSREEVLLAIFEQQFADWSATLQAELARNPSDEAFCAVFLQTAVDQPALIPLLLSLNSVIEHNISVNALVQSKRAMQEEMNYLAGSIAESLGLSETQSLDLLFALGPLFIGAAQHELSPRLESTPLPLDVREFIDSFATSSTFTPNAYRLIRSIRAGN